MGLEMVEVVIRTEEAFGVRIDDEDASKMGTVGDLRDHVIAMISAATATLPGKQGCLTSAAFYQVRRALMKIFGVDRRSVTPESSLEAVLPRRHRRARWGEFRRELGIPVPDLVPPGWTAMLIGACTIWAVVAVFAPFMFNVPFPIRVVSWISPLVAILITMALATRIPNDHSILRDLSVRLAASAVLLAEPTSPALREAEVWARIQVIVADVLGVDIAKVTPEARFVADLGAG